MLLLKLHARRYYRLPILIIRRAAAHVARRRFRRYKNPPDMMATIRLSLCNENHASRAISDDPALLTEYPGASPFPPCDDRCFNRLGTGDCVCLEWPKPFPPHLARDPQLRHRSAPETLGIRKYDWGTFGR